MSASCHSVWAPEPMPGRWRENVGSDYQRNGREAEPRFLPATLPVASAEDDGCVLELCFLRWRIEGWHGILKSGCGIERAAHRAPRAAGARRGRQRCDRLEARRPVGIREGTAGAGRPWIRHALHAHARRSPEPQARRAARHENLLDRVRAPRHRGPSLRKAG